VKYVLLYFIYLPEDGQNEKDKRKKKARKGTLLTN